MLYYLVSLFSGNVGMYRRVHSYLSLLLLLFVAGCGQAPSRPMNLEAVALSATEISLTWDASEDDSGVVTYKVYRDGEFIMYSSETTVTDSGLQPLTEYCYTVQAYDMGWLKSEESNTACATTLADTDPPSAPQNLTVTAVTSTEVSLEWDPSTDNVAVTGYNLYRDGVLILTVEETTATDTGLTPSTEYCYTVEAFDEAGNTSEPSGEVCVSTEA